LCLICQMKWSWLLLSLLLAALLATSFVRADSDDDEIIETEEEDIPTGGAGAGGAAAAGSADDEVVETDVAPVELIAHPDVATVSLFPDYADKKFYVGTEIVALIGLTNSGSKTFNISSVQGFLHSPFDYTYYIQNFTARHFASAVLKPNEQLTLEYTFKPDKSLEALEFWLSGYVDYNATAEEGKEPEQFRSYFTNSTIELIEKQSDANVKRVFTYFLATAAAGIVGYIAWSLTNPQQSSSSSSSSTSSSSSGKSRGESSEWEAEVYKPAKESRAVGRKRAPRE